MTIVIHESVNGTYRDYISKTIINKIQASAKYKITSGMKQREFQFELQNIGKKLELLKKKAQDTKNEIESLDKIYITSAKKGKSTINPKADVKPAVEKRMLRKAGKVKKVAKDEKVLNKNPKKKTAPVLVNKLLEEKFKLLDKAQQELKEAKDLLNQTQSKFGTHKAAKSILRSLTDFVDSLDGSHEYARKVLSKIANDQKPSILTDDNKLMKHLSLYIKESVNDITEYEKKPKVGLSYYTVDRGNVSGIRFSRYIEIINAPKLDNSPVKSLYVVVSVDLRVPKQDQGKVTGTFSPLYVTMSPHDIRPKNLSASLEINKKLDVENNLAVLAYRNGLSLFTKDIKTDTETRRGILVEKDLLRILKDPAIKTKSEGSKFKVLLPYDSVVWAVPGKKLRKDWEEHLYVDVKRLLRLPMSKNVASRHTVDRLKIESISIKTAKAKKVLITFNLLPVGSTKLNTDKGHVERSTLSPDTFKKVLLQELYKDNRNR